MAESFEDLSPWSHPKAQRWFRELFAQSSLPLALDDEIAQAEQSQDFDKIRMIIGLLVLIGREGIWPEDRVGLVRDAVRTANKISQKPRMGKDGKPMTLAEAQGTAVNNEELKHEIELVRRRYKLSNRKGALGAPASWGNIWS